MLLHRHSVLHRRVLKHAVKYSKQRKAFDATISTYRQFNSNSQKWQQTLKLQDYLYIRLRKNKDDGKNYIERIIYGKTLASQAAVSILPSKRSKFTGDMGMQENILSKDFCGMPKSHRFMKERVKFRNLLLQGNY